MNQSDKQKVSGLPERGRRRLFYGDFFEKELSSLFLYCLRNRELSKPTSNMLLWRLASSHRANMLVIKQDTDACATCINSLYEKSCLDIPKYVTFTWISIQQHFSYSQNITKLSFTKCIVVQL